jgi:hypothetical protein
LAIIVRRFINWQKTVHYLIPTTNGTPFLTWQGQKSLKYLRADFTDEADTHTPWQEPVAKESSENVDSCALKWQLYIWFTNWWTSGGGGTSNPKTQEQWQANHQQHQTGWNSGAIQYWRQLNIPILHIPLTQPMVGFPIARVPGHFKHFLEQFHISRFFTGVQKSRDIAIHNRELGR